MIKRMTLLVFLSFALVLTAAPQPQGRMVLSPELPEYFVGQDINLVLEIDVMDAELGGNLNLQGLPERTWAGCGEFREMSGETFTRDGQLVTRKRFGTVMRLLRPGSHVLKPSVSGNVTVRHRRGFMIMSSQTPFHLRFPELEVRVSALPDPPADFYGGIGHFSLSATLAPTQASPGDILKLEWIMDGIGNLEFSQLPACSSTEEYKTYPPREESREASRRISVSQVLIPQSLGATNSPVLSFSIFNPLRREYVQLSAGPFKVDLQARSEGAETADTGWKPDNAVQAPPGSREGLPVEMRGRFAASPLMALFGGLAAALFLFSALLRRSRWTAISLTCLTLLAALGARWLLEREKRGTVLVLREEAAARLCPSSEARILTRLPEGSRLRIMEQTERWIRVEADGASGWIPADKAALPELP